MAPKDKAIEVVNMHKPLSIKGANGYGITYCDAVLNNNPSLTNEKRVFWQEVKKEIENL